MSYCDKKVDVTLQREMTIHSSLAEGGDHTESSLAERGDQTELSGRER